MNPSKVYFTDFRCRPDQGPADKLKKFIKAAGGPIPGRFPGKTCFDLVHEPITAYKLCLREYREASYFEINYT